MAGPLRIERAGPGVVRAKDAAAMGIWGMPPRKFMNFRRSEIDSGAFWDAFPALQGTRTNRVKTVSLLQICSVTHVVCTRRTMDRTPPKSRSHILPSIIIIIIITHTKIGAQQNRSISMTIWTSSRLDFFPSPTMGSWSDYSLAGLDVPGKGTSGHYCQHSVIQWNFISVTSRHSVTRKNVIANRLCAGVTGGNDYHQALE